MTMVALMPRLTAQAQELPYPDIPAIMQAAQRPEPHLDYVMLLPSRRLECKRLAIPYLNSGTTAAMAAGSRIFGECHAAMLIKLAELYYQSEAFGAGGMPALLDRLQTDMFTLYGDLYDYRRVRRGHSGSITLLFRRADVYAVLEEAARTMALQLVDDDDHREWLKRWDASDW